MMNPASPTVLLPSQRHLFDLPRDVAYLNCAYMGPLPRTARDAGERAVGRKSSPWTIRPADFFEGPNEARRLFASLIGADPSDIALVPSVSYGMAVACAILPVAAGQRVLLLDEEFPSVIHPWRERARAVGAEPVLLPRPADDDWTRVVLEAIDERTAVAALPVCHWTDGALLDLEPIAARLRDVGATLAVDATQSVGALPFDVGVVRPDLLVVAAYKWLLGPYTTGFLYVAPRWQGGNPIEHNWITREGAEDFAGLTRYRNALQPGARRFDMGEVSNFALLPMLLVSLRQLLDWEVSRIGATLQVTTADVVRRAGALGYTAVPDALRAPHYLGLRRPGGVPRTLGEHLAARGVFVSLRGPALRVTPHLYNDREDVDRFLDALAAAA
jgi:selenocysteine lyase/cysteine desulfurase